MKGLDKRFAEDIRTTVNRIAKRPFSHAVRYRNIRIAHPDVFPFSIHYYIDEQEHKIIITAIVHNNRNPPFAQERTDS